MPSHTGGHESPLEASQSAPGWVLGEGLIKIGIGVFVHLDSPWLRWSCRCGEVRVGRTPKPPYVSITLASADAEAAPAFLDHSPDFNLGLDQSPDCNLDSDRDQGYDSPHEEATVQAGRATGQCERGGAAPGPGTSVGGHRRTDRLSSRNALLPLFWPRRPGRVPTGRAPARGGRNNRARRHNPPATSRPATVSDNRARRVPRGAARTMRRPAVLRGSHRTTRNPDGRQGRAPRHATSKGPRRG